MSRLFPEVRDFFRRTFGGKYIELRNSGGAASNDDGIIVTSSQGNVHLACNAYATESGEWHRIDTARGASVIYLDGENSALKLITCGAGANPIVWSLSFAVDSRSGTVSSAWDPPSIPAGSTAGLVLGVSGAVVGDFVLVGDDWPARPIGLVRREYVNAPGDVRVVYHNTTGAAIDPPAHTVYVRVLPR